MKLERGLLLHDQTRNVYEAYCPFIGTELIKVITGIHRCGKSVMLELIQQELIECGISSSQFISINFEDMSHNYLQTANYLHDKITKKPLTLMVKSFFFSMKFRK